MASLVLTVRETLRYRGAIGQWSWVLHRLTGLGVVFFLVLHVIDTSWAAFYPEQYAHAIASYQSPLFTLGEFGLIAAIVYHALNGIRISIFDAKPELWVHQEKAAYAVLGGSVLLLIPVFLIMGNDVIQHYSKPDVVVLPLADVIAGQLPFIAGMGVALAFAVVLSGLYGMITSNDAPERGVKKPRSSETTRTVERFWWSFMRISGVLILVLVFGHLAMMHVIQGVFDITVAGDVVGTGFQNTSGTAVEFVADRWAQMLGPIYIWRVYDLFLLGLVTMHGFNGLRYVLTDYTNEWPTVRRAMVYLCTIGGVILLVVGGAALFSTVSTEAIEQAEHALRAVAQSK
jgi:succinate dehydrogenase / fumarate reductase, cytochrome b subunit